MTEFKTFDWTMSQLFLSTMRESDPELSPGLFVHSSYLIKAAIKILKNVHGGMVPVVGRFPGNRNTLSDLSTITLLVIFHYTIRQLFNKSMPQTVPTGNVFIHKNS